MVREVTNFNNVTLIRRNSANIFNDVAILFIAPLTLSKIKESEIGFGCLTLAVYYCIVALFTFVLRISLIVYSTDETFRTFPYLNFIQGFLLRICIYIITLLVFDLIYSQYSLHSSTFFTKSVFSSIAIYSIYNIIYYMVKHSIAASLSPVVISISTFYLLQNLRDHLDIKDEKEMFKASIIMLLFSIINMGVSYVVWVDEIN